MGLETRKDNSSVYFKNHQIDLYLGKLYLVVNATKTEIATIKGCSSDLNRTWKNKCSTGWNVNSVQYTDGSLYLKMN
jgi:hypothetical protein